MIPVILAMLVQAQQPGHQPTTQAPATQAPAARPAPMQTVVRAPTSTPRTPYDSTLAAIRRIGVAVAEVKSGLDALNRAVAREPNGVVVERATTLQTQCQALARSAASRCS